MKTIRFVKAAHSFGEDEFGEEPILTSDDVDVIVDRKLQMLSSDVDRMEREYRELRNRVADIEQNRQWLWENVDVIKKFLVGNVETAVGRMQNYSANNHNVLAGLDAAWETRRRLDKLPDSCREIFGNVIRDSLSPKLEQFSGQVKRLESQIARLEQEDRASQLKAISGQIAKLESQIARLENEDRTTQFNTLGREIGELKLQIACVKENTTSRFETICGEVGELGSQIDGLKRCISQFGEFENKIVDLESQIARSQGEQKRKTSWLGSIISWFKGKDTTRVVSEVT